MAGALTCHFPEREISDEALDLIEAVRGERPSMWLFPMGHGLEVRRDGELVGYAHLYQLDGVLIGAVDWVSIAPGADEAERVEILAVLAEGIREKKSRHDLRAIMIHNRYPEIRRLLDGAEDLHPGETGMKRLVFRP